MRAGYLRKNGVPYSEDAVVTEAFHRHDEPNGDVWFTVTTIVEDPRYLTQPFITSTSFKQETGPVQVEPDAVPDRGAAREAAAAGPGRRSGRLAARRAIRRGAVVTAMHRLVKSAFVVASVILLPSAAYAQASIAGVVRDALGGRAARRHGRGRKPGPDRKGPHASSPTAAASTASSTCVPEPTA